MTLYELKELQASKHWNNFIYLSENQPGYYCGNPVKVGLKFSNMTIGYTPGLCSVFISNGLTWLRIDTVKGVECRSYVLGDVLTIACESGDQYIIIAQ